MLSGFSKRSQINLSDGFCCNQPLAKVCDISKHIEARVFGCGCIGGCTTDVSGFRHLNSSVQPLNIIQGLTCSSCIELQVELFDRRAPPVDETRDLSFLGNNQALNFSVNRQYL